MTFSRWLRIGFLASPLVAAAASGYQYLRATVQERRTAQGMELPQNKTLQALRAVAPDAVDSVAQAASETDWKAAGTRLQTQVSKAAEISGLQSMGIRWLLFGDGFKSDWSHVGRALTKTGLYDMNLQF